jgi:hypothetical protein
MSDFPKIVKKPAPEEEMSNVRVEVWPDDIRVVLVYGGAFVARAKDAAGAVAISRWPYVSVTKGGEAWLPDVLALPGGKVSVMLPGWEVTVERKPETESETDAE